MVRVYRSSFVCNLMRVRTWNVIFATLMAVVSQKAMRKHRTHTQAHLLVNCGMNTPREEERST